MQNVLQHPIVCTRNALLLGLCFLGSTTLVGADWPQYRGANHDGISSETILVSWPAGGLRQIWKTPTDSGFSSFTVAGNQAFTLVRRQANGMEDEVCLALDATTGKELWAATVGQAKYRGGNGPRSPPSVDGDAIYVLSAYLTLFRLDASSGKVVWKTDLTSGHSSKVIQWQNAASPVLDGDLIFVAGNVPKELGTNAAFQPLLAFNKKDGSLA
jgi:outer membrane protein assembly factor BamB